MLQRVMRSHPMNPRTFARSIRAPSPAARPGTAVHRGSCIRRSAPEFRVPALLDDPAVLEHDDLVGVHDGGEAVGDHEARPVLHEHVQGDLYLSLRLGVEGRCGLVQNEDGSVFSSARAMAIRWRCPPESFTPDSPMIVS